MLFKRYTLALLLGALFAPSAQANQDYSPEWLLGSVQKACQSVAEGVARCLAGPSPITLPALPSPFPGMDPKTNPYLVHTPYARPTNVTVSSGSLADLAKPTAGAASTTAETARPAGSETSANASGANMAARATTPPGSPIPARVTPDATIPAAVASSLTMPGIASPDLAKVMPRLQASTPTPAGTPLPGNAPTNPSPTPAPTSAALLTRTDDALTYFEFDKSELTDAGRAALDAWYERHVAGYRTHVTGHADRFGRNAYNLALSRRRAESVGRYLMAKGMKPEEILIIAKGESEPLISCDGGLKPETIACLAPNRRVEVVSDKAQG